MSQRKHSVVRVCGEEHFCTGAGKATTWLTLDNDMAYVSEMKFKLVLGNPNSNAGGVLPDTPTGTGNRPVVHGNNTWPTMQAFLEAYPVGAWIDVGNGLGAQCYNYAWAFWWGQVNRNLTTCEGGSPDYCSGYARDLWKVLNARRINAGTEFDLIYNWSEIKPGDWVIWGNGQFGHVAMAADYPSGSSCDFYGQNQGGAAVSNGGAAINVANLNSNGFLGAFRYKKWN